jgi:hypothetical protein
MFNFARKILTISPAKNIKNKYMIPRYRYESMILRNLVLGGRWLKNCMSAQNVNPIPRRSEKDNTPKLFSLPNKNNKGKTKSLNTMCKPERKALITKC